MRWLRCDYSLKGLGAERLLDLLQRQGIQLLRVERRQDGSLLLSCPQKQAAQLEQTAAACGFSALLLPARGGMLYLRRLRKRFMLPICLFIAFLLLAAALQFIWQVEIDGAGIYAGEVRAYLLENGIHPGILKRSVDRNALCDGLLYRLPRIAWVRAEVRGVTLTVHVTRGTPSPALYAANAAGDIVAEQDGVITRIDVYSGTAAVKQGTAVKAGDVLIRGAERTGDRGEPMAVPARGQAWARVWISASAAVPCTEIRSIPTGRSSIVRTFSLGPFRKALDEAPDYLASDAETRTISLAGAWLPLQYTETAYYEVAQETGMQDEAAVQAEAGALALRNLLVKCGGKHEMIDKSVVYSMINGDTILATATAEMLLQIGRYAPTIPD